MSSAGGAKALRPVELVLSDGTRDALPTSLTCWRVR
jgi:hypothetical protein